ncbi:MAG TPA: hypothetical protein VLY24_26225 [Bryobacteraceae bacterium]|nr:hypothetical protein [Bryobacteraceae bacterium]
MRVKCSLACSYYSDRTLHKPAWSKIASRAEEVPSLFLVVIEAVLCVVASAAAEPWLIVLRPQAGAITASTTRKDLVSRYGSVNVRDQDVGVGEGETEPGTVLFPRDPRRTIEILWKDPSTKISPKSLIVRGEASRWKMAHEISLGTSLIDLEHINRKPFLLSGFGWDYSGTVTSWQNGELDRDLEGYGRVILRLDYSTAQTSVTQPELDQVMGDGIFPSSHSVRQRLNPRVYEIIWDLRQK